MMNWKAFERKWPRLIYFSGICLKGLRKIAINMVGIVCADRESNRISLKCKAGGVEPRGNHPLPKCEEQS
jgi:hypothetical protein